MPKYNGYILPELPPWDKPQYPVALISVYPEGFASLAFVDKRAYLVDFGDGERLYTLLQTSEDPYDDNRMIYAREFVAAWKTPVSEGLKILFPGINASEWLEVPWALEDQNLPSGAHYAVSCGSGPHWSNTTLYDEAGNQVIEASGISRFWVELEDWLRGFVLGLAGEPLPLKSVADGEGE